MSDYELQSTMAIYRMTEEVRVAVEPRLTIELREIKLVDYPNGNKCVFAEGRHIRKDGEPGRHRRGAWWDAPQPMPDVVRALVEAERPGWWESNG